MFSSSDKSLISLCKKKIYRTTSTKIELCLKVNNKTLTGVPVQICQFHKGSSSCINIDKNINAKGNVKELTSVLILGGELYQYDIFHIRSLLSGEYICTDKHCKLEILLKHAKTC